MARLERLSSREQEKTLHQREWPALQVGSFIYRTSKACIRQIQTGREESSKRKALELTCQIAGNREEHSQNGQEEVESGHFKWEKVDDLKEKFVWLVRVVFLLVLSDGRLTVPLA